MRTFHKDGTLPKYGEAVFVFGSNLAGIHGAGAARAAHDEFGAIYGTGEGSTGGAYAIPTKDKRVHTMSLDAIQPHVLKFLEFARLHSGVKFFVTRIGCGLAGYTDAQIAPMFKDAPENCDLPEQWREYVGAFNPAPGHMTATEVVVRRGFL